MKCPNCGVINPEGSSRCVCGHNFATYMATHYRSFKYMGSWDFFSNSWRTFGSNWNTFLILAAIPTLLFLGLALTTGEGLNGVTKSMPHLIVTLITSIVVWVVSTLSTMALMMAAHKTSDGQVIGVWESYNLTFALFWRFIWTGLLYSLIVLGGLFLLIIPGIIWAIRFFFAPFLVIIEGIGGREALSRSKAITKDRKGAIFFRELGFGLLFLLIIRIPLLLLILLVGVGLGKGATGFSESAPLWAQTIQLFGNSISTALFVIFNVLLYKSLHLQEDELENEEKALREAHAERDLKFLAEVSKAKGKYDKADR